MRPGIAWLVVSLLPFLAGCGDPDLWARWRAERTLWDAHRRADRVLLRPDGPRPQDWAMLERRFHKALDEFPASRWVPLAPGGGPARDIAAASGDAALVLGELAARQGHDDIAVTRWRQVAADYFTLPDVVLEARLSEADALARLGRHAEKLVALRAVVDSTPLVDAQSHRLRTRMLTTTRWLARELQESGRSQEAATMLHSAEERFTAALGLPGTPDRSALASALSDVRGALGDVPGSLAALRLALRAAPASQAPTRVLSLAEQALALGASDSVFAYARWAATLDRSRNVAGPALLAMAAAFEQQGRSDSALASYDALFARWESLGPLEAEARYRRGILLEHLGRWELARGEFRTLAAALPTDPRAFQGLRRIVQHSIDLGQFDLAQVEGDATIANLRHLIVTNRDPLVQREARVVHAEVLLALGRGAMAESSFVDLWRRFPGDSTTEAGALRAARIAEHLPGGADRARQLYLELRRAARNATVRHAADAALTGRGATQH
ncbi:MAG: tetratricopeptide repeat protein [Candidatus Eisenbacteria bacterium]